MMDRPAHPRMEEAMAVADPDRDRPRVGMTVTRYHQHHHHHRMIEEDEGVRRTRRRGPSLPVRSIESMVGIGPIAEVGGDLVLDHDHDLGVEVEAGACPGMKIGGGGARTERGIDNAMATTEIESTARITDEEEVAAGVTATPTDREAIKKNLAVSKRPRP